ncbi:MAG: NEL-type E3 ubiquitin ligase domain-containing protein [Candidatus Margulisiibacteriota bacterium]
MAERITNRNSFPTELIRTNEPPSQTTDRSRGSLAENNSGNGNLILPPPIISSSLVAPVRPSLGIISTASGSSTASLGTSISTSTSTTEVGVGSACSLQGLLYAWDHEANINPEELRQEAVMRILNCYGTASHELNLSRLRLTSLPRELFDFLPQLTILDLSNNQLTALPSLDHLGQLTDISVSNNQLTALPSLDHLEQLVNFDLANNQLTVLPSLDHLGQLAGIRVSNNQLTALPSLDHLGQLIFINVSNNQLTALPSLDHLGQSLGVIQAERNRFSPETIIEFQSRFNGTQVRVYIGIYEPQALTPVRHVEDRRSLETLINAIKNSAGDSKDFSGATSTASGASTSNSQADIWKQTGVDYQNFRTFLLRLGDTADGKDSQKSQIIRQTVLNIINLMEQNKEFRERCLVLATESVATCGDRIALGFVNMQIQYQIYGELLSGEITPQKLFLAGERLSRVDCLYHLAKEKVAHSTGVIDEIEVYLGLLTALNPRLKLGLNITNMLYRACSGLRSKDYEDAEEKVKENEPISICRFLADFEPCKKYFTKEYEAVTKDFDDQLDNLDSSKLTSQEYKTQIEHIRTNRNQVIIMMLQEKITTANKH